MDKSEFKRCSGKRGCGELKHLQNFSLRDSRDGTMVPRAICIDCYNQDQNMRRAGRRGERRLAKDSKRACTSCLVQKVASNFLEESKTCISCSFSQDVIVLPHQILEPNVYAGSLDYETYQSPVREQSVSPVSVAG